MTADETRQVVISLNKREDTENWDAAFWRNIAEGPWLEQRLAAVEARKKYGTNAASEPKGSPKVSAQVHAWAAAGPDGDRWILGAYEAQGYSVGDATKKAEPYWSLYHQRKGGGWRRTFLALAPSRTALPAVATGRDGQAVTSGDVSKLATPPSSVCRHYGDYVAGRSGTGAEDDALWSKEIRTARASAATAEKDLRARFYNPASVNFSEDPESAHHGPIWRTTDGGALVACIVVTKTTIAMGSGRYVKFASSGWPGTVGVRWAAFTQSQLSLTVLKVPAESHEVSIAARASWPYRFDGTRYTSR
ncbi:hypothetical protein [Streptomyces sp. NPDC002676]